MTYIVELANVNSKSINEVGGKGANLGEMRNAGFPIPKGFCVTSSAYDAFIKENGFEQMIHKALLEIDERPEKAYITAVSLQNTIKEGRLPAGMEDDITEAYARIKHTRVAVRSSATAEDLPDASFAGQQDTYLNIQGAENLLIHIKKCFASLWTERAVMYRKRSGYDKEKISLSVIVQEMVESEISGVMFTVNPVNNSMNEIMINASFGLGEAVVSGMVTPDTFIWNTQSESVTSRLLGSKELSIVYSGDGTVQMNNSIEKQKAYSLNENQIKTLALLGKKIEKHFGRPQDIEWAIKDGKLYILQSRAVTTLKNAEKPTKKSKRKQSRIEKGIMNNMLEHSPDPLYPLDAFAICDVQDVKSKVFSELGIKMGGKYLTVNRDGSLAFHVPSVGISPRLIPAIINLKGYCDYKKNVSITKTGLDAIQKRLDSLEKSNVTARSEKQLTADIRTVLKMASEINVLRFRYNVFPNVIINKRINMALKRGRLDFSEYDLLSGLSYKTWEMNMDLGRLAALIQSVPGLKQRLDSLDGNIRNELEDSLKEHWDVYIAFQDFMKKYGWKSTCTYRAFSAASWNEDPSTLLVLLKNTAPSNKPSSEKYDQLISGINHAFSAGKAQKIIAWVNEIRGYHVNREQTLYMLEQCYGLCRLMAKQLAIRQRDVFSSYEDVLRLTCEELFDLENISPDELRHIIRNRQHSQVKNRQLWDSMEVDSVQNSRHEIRGISGSTGKVKGRVCIILGTEEFSKLKSGDILVCKYTDPVWTPLFTIAKAVVSDTGGPLSHSAIVAREYHIPAVLGCGNATQLLEDGQEIVVDGDNGVVKA